MNPGWGYSDIFIYTCRPGPCFVRKFKFKYLLGFSVNKCIYGYEDFVDIFRDLHIFGLVFGVISMHFRVFSKGQGIKWRYVFGLLKFLIFFGVLDIPDVFLELTVRWVQAYV